MSQAVGTTVGLVLVSSIILAVVWAIDLGVAKRKARWAKRTNAAISAVPNKAYCAGCDSIWHPSQMRWSRDRTALRCPDCVLRETSEAS